MKLSYFELLSPAPVYIRKVGGILSPKLKDISSLGITAYQSYLALLQMDFKSYVTMLGQPELFDTLSVEEKSQIHMFELFTADGQSAALLQNALNFFIRETVLFSSKNHCFLIQDENQLIGRIDKENYPQICDLIFQRNCIKSNPKEDFSKVKNKKALEIMKKLQKGRNEKAKQTKADKNMELGNIISAVANKSPSLNIVNIWELTVFQLWDCFSRLSNNSIYDIQSMSVAAYGDKDHSFDAAAWFKRIY